MGESEGLGDRLNRCHGLRTIAKSGLDRADRPDLRGDQYAVGVHLGVTRQQNAAFIEQWR